MPHKHIEKRIGKKTRLVKVRDNDCMRRHCFWLMVKPDGKLVCKTMELFGCQPHSKIPLPRKD